MSMLALASTYAEHDGPGAWWPIFPLLWLAIIATAVVLLRRGRCGYRRGMGALEERFARGEIDAAEYRERRDVLKGKA